MKSISGILAFAGTAVATSYAAFKVPHLTTHQPSGAKFDYYEIAFNVTGAAGASTSWCRAWWGDDIIQTPVDKWLPCTTEYQGDKNTDVSFQLNKQLEIGDFTFSLQQNYTDTTTATPSQTILTTDPYHISNTTSDTPYNCTINPFDNGFNIHASGDCATTSPLSIPVSNAAPACPHAKAVSLSFPVQVRTAYGDSIYIVGSIPELGNWDLSRAVALNADKYTSEPNGDIWGGGEVSVAAGTTFEWKVVQKNADGSWLWECGENWVSTVDAFTCGEQTIGNNPTWMRCGDH